MVDSEAIRERYAAVGQRLNARSRRLFAAAEARTAGYGGISASSRATGIARSTIGRGLRDLNDPGLLSGVVRRPGSGRRALTVIDATLLEDLRQMLEPATMGDPMRPLLWVSKSHAKLAVALCAMGHQIAKSSIPKQLGLLKYRRQGNRKPWKAAVIPTVTPSSSTSMPRWSPCRRRGQPVMPLTLRKRSWSVRTKTVGQTIGRRAVPT